MNRKPSKHRHLWVSPWTKTPLQTRGAALRWDPSDEDDSVIDEEGEELSALWPFAAENGGIDRLGCHKESRDR